MPSIWVATRIIPSHKAFCLMEWNDPFLYGKNSANTLSAALANIPYIHTFYAVICKFAASLAKFFLI